MKLRDLWNRRKRRGRVPIVLLMLPADPGAPRPFEPLTHDESLAVLQRSISWLINESRVLLAMPEGRARERRMAELHAHERCIQRDYARLLGEREG